MCTILKIPFCLFQMISSRNQHQCYQILNFRIYPRTSYPRTQKKISIHLQKINCSNMIIKYIKRTMIKAEEQKSAMTFFEEVGGLIVLKEIFESDEGKITYYVFKSHAREFSVERIYVDRENVLERFKDHMCRIQTQLQSEHILKLTNMKTRRGDSLVIYHEQVLKTLDNCIDTLSYKKKMCVLNSIAQALLYMSKMHISHNAVRPDSITICQQFSCDITAKLSNFYYAVHLRNSLKYFEKDDRHKTMTEYSSPQMRYKDMIGLNSDVWSLGVIFYEMVFGKRKIKVSSSQVRFDLPKITPSWMRVAFEGFLAFDPKKRYDIIRASLFLKSALVSAEQAQKIVRDLNLTEMVEIKV